MNVPVISKLKATIDAQVARMKPRERKLVVGLGLVALVIAPIKAFDMAQTALERNLQARSELEAARQLAKGARGGGVQGQIAKQQQEIRSWSWQAASPAIGRVIIQDQIATLAAEAGMREPDIRSAEKIEQVGDVSLVRIDVAAPFTWASYTAFLASLNRIQKGFLIDSMVLEDDDQPRIKITLKLPMVVAGDKIS